MVVCGAYMVVRFKRCFICVIVVTGDVHRRTKLCLPFIFHVSRYLSCEYVVFYSIAQLSTFQFHYCQSMRKATSKYKWDVELASPGWANSS